MQLESYTTAAAQPRLLRIDRPPPNQRCHGPTEFIILHVMVTWLQGDIRQCHFMAKSDMRLH
jgi:hypothetical protein